MAKLRKASAYSKRYARPYTRKSKSRTKSYVKTVPNSKIVKFDMGKIKNFVKGEFPFQLIVTSDEKVTVQIRDNAIEACRQTIQREIDKPLMSQFYIGIRIVPHHILRENKMLTGAGADRMQSGMKHSYGKSVGRAAFVKPGKEIFIIAVKDEKGVKLVREAIRKIKPKLACKVKVKVVKQEIKKEEPKKE
jgi:large subunit ribosomal protein L10e